MITSIYEATYLVDFSKDIIVSWGEPSEMVTKQHRYGGNLNLCGFNKLTFNMLNSLELYTGRKAL